MLDLSATSQPSISTQIYAFDLSIESDTEDNNPELS